MKKEVKYEARCIEDVVVDLADEIKNGWRIYGCRYPDITISCCSRPEITVEIALSKEF